MIPWNHLLHKILESITVESTNQFVGRAYIFTTLIRSELPLSLLFVISALLPVISLELRYLSNVGFTVFHIQ